MNENVESTRMEMWEWCAWALTFLLALVIVSAYIEARREQRYWSHTYKYETYRSCNRFGCRSQTGWVEG